MACSKVGYGTCSRCGKVREVHFARPSEGPAEDAEDTSREAYFEKTPYRSEAARQTARKRAQLRMF